MTEKVLGYILLAVGIGLIFWGFLSTYQVFTGKSHAYNLFNLPGIEMDFSNFVGLDSPEAQSANIDRSKLRSEIVKAELINKPLNLFFFVMFAGFIVTVGFRIASLGVMLVRPIKVNLKEEKNQPLLAK